MANGLTNGYINYTSINSYDFVRMDIMDDRFKRLNTLTGKLFEPGFKDENGRFFLRYLKKQGNDGYYLEEWKKDFESFVKKAKELNINFDSNLQ